LIEIRVFRNSRKCLRTSREIPNSGKKSAVFGFQDDADTAYFWKIRKKFPGKSDVFGGKFPENPKIGKFGNSGKFRKKKCKNVDFGIQPSFAARFKTHILELKSIKKK
jgi:hypothetical protein